MVEKKEAKNVTGEQYKAILKKQNNGCAICGKAESAIHQGEPRRLAIDHCHDSKGIRGLLCVKCNIGIGQFCDNPKLLQKAALYPDQAQRSG